MINNKINNKVPPKFLVGSWELHSNGRHTTRRPPPPAPPLVRVVAVDACAEPPAGRVPELAVGIKGKEGWRMGGAKDERCMEGRRRTVQSN